MPSDSGYRHLDWWSTLESAGPLSFVFGHVCPFLTVPSWSLSNRKRSSCGICGARVSFPVTSALNCAGYARFAKKPILSVRAEPLSPEAASPLLSQMAIRRWLASFRILLPLSAKINLLCVPRNSELLQRFAVHPDRVVACIYHSS